MKQSKDYYFYVGYSNEYSGVFMTICDTEFFEKNGYVEDKHISKRLKGFLPKGIGEEAESLFSSDYSVEETEKLMLENGFVKSEKYSNFAKSHDPFVYAQNSEYDESDL